MTLSGPWKQRMRRVKRQRTNDWLCDSDRAQRQSCASRSVWRCHSRRWMAAGLVLLSMTTGVRAAEDPVFDVAALIATPLNARTLKRTERDNVITEEVMFHSEMDGEKAVDIFAFFSYPQGAKGLPSYIWNQG